MVVVTESTPGNDCTEGTPGGGAPSTEGDGVDRVQAVFAGLNGPSHAIVWPQSCGHSLRSWDCLALKLRHYQDLNPTEQLPGQKGKVKVAQLCLTLRDPMDCTIHGILQARMLEWVAFPFSRGSS